MSDKTVQEIVREFYTRFDIPDISLNDFTGRLAEGEDVQPFSSLSEYKYEFVTHVYDTYGSRIASIFKIQDRYCKLECEESSYSAPYYRPFKTLKEVFPAEKVVTYFE